MTAATRMVVWRQQFGDILAAVVLMDRSNTTCDRLATLRRTSARGFASHLKAGTAPAPATPCIHPAEMADPGQMAPNRQLGPSETDVTSTSLIYSSCADELESLLVHACGPQTSLCWERGFGMRGTAREFAISHTEHPVPYLW